MSSAERLDASAAGACSSAARASTRSQFLDCDRGLRSWLCRRRPPAEKGDGAQNGGLVAFAEGGKHRKRLLGVLVFAQRKGVETALLHEVEVVVEHVTDGAQFALCSGSARAAAAPSNTPRPSPNFGKFTAMTAKCPTSLAIASGPSCASSQMPTPPCRAPSSSRSAIHSDSGTMTSPLVPAKGESPTGARSSSRQVSATIRRCFDQLCHRPTP